MDVVASILGGSGCMNLVFCHMRPSVFKESVCGKHIDTWKILRLQNLDKDNSSLSELHAHNIICPIIHHPVS